MQHFLAINALVSGIIMIIFGIIVLVKNYKNILNQTLFLLTLATAMWSFSYWQWLSVYDNKDLALFWVRLLTIWSTMIPIFYFHWIVSLLELNKKLRKFVIGSYILVLIFLLFSFSSLFIKEVVPYKDYFTYWPQAGPLYSLYLLFVYFGLVIYSVYLLLTHYRFAVGLKKLQIKYVLLGAVIGFSGGSTNFFLWYNIDILPFGTIFVIVYPILFSYSIIRHRLMDIKFVMRRYSVYLVSLLLVIIPLTIIKYFINLYFLSLVDFIDFLLLFIALLIFPIVKNKVYHFANKYFFSSLYDSSEVIGKISNNLRTTLNVNRIYDYIYLGINEAMHVKSFGILKYNNKKHNFSTEYNINFNIGRRVKFEQNKYLQEIFTKNNKPIIVPEVKQTHYNENTKETIDALEVMHVDMLYPLVVKDKIVGLMVMGMKESGDMYNDEDLQVLSIVASQSAIAIENAMLYEETKDFSVKMEEEVKRATADLRAANERLKKLDEAKSEFISIASHQLRTPLTVIKGYISMILEGSFGPLANPIKSSLDKVYESNERLISLVENLLNISRIESGRLKFDFQDIQFEKVIKSVIEELTSTAEDKGIELKFNKLKKNLPKIKIDLEKIRQVLMNLTDNAIKYSQAGTVVLSLRRKQGDLLFCVQDNGIGISKDDMPELFKKFARGTSASMEHTEGTGLGLFVAKQMISAHHGHIWVESQGEGKGAKFCFTLPFKK